MTTKHYSHKWIKKSMKKDELRDVLDRLYAYSKKNAENLLITVIIIAVFSILIPMYFNNRNQNELRAGSLMNRAINISLQPVAEGVADPAKGEFRTLNEKYKKLEEAYAEIAGTYRNTRSARLALIGQADALFYQKEYARAVPIYEAAKLKETDPQFKLSLDQKLAACLENQGKWQEALTGYNSLLAAKPDYFNKRAVRLAAARCYQNLGQQPKAEELWQQASQDEPGSYWAELAKSELQGQK